MFFYESYFVGIIGN